jgi:Tfp pilus assembly protein PilO
MKLKILIVPLMVILAIYVFIAFVKPDYDSLMAKRTTLEQKKAEFARLETLQSNINSLTSNLDQNKELEDFALRFYPLELEQERVIDAFNFLASQTGPVITGMDIKEVLEQKEDPATQSASALNLEPGLSEEGRPPVIDGAPPMLIYTPADPNSFTAKVSLKGNYDNIKSFFAEMYRLDRMHDVKMITVGVDTKEAATTDGEPAPPSDLLVATFEARFDYVDDKDNKTALGAPIFSKSSFDMDQAAKLKAWAETSIPVLNVDQAGRANPFL